MKIFAMNLWHFFCQKNIFRNKPKLPDIKFTLFLQCYQNNEGYDYSKTTTLIYHFNKYSHLRLDDNISRTSIDNMLIWCHMALPMIHYSSLQNVTVSQQCNTTISVTTSYWFLGLITHLLVGDKTFFK